MPFATWWRGDPLLELPPLPSFASRRVASLVEARRVTGLAEHPIATRFQRGHRLYSAVLDDEPVAYGWAAMQSGGIEELDFSFDVPPGTCYL
jgi:hypothetical protein